ncbi:MAG TPA: septum formation initiator family protein [Rhodospirillaceae bacterium]|nr:septum formation initiator family protein [Rhodospirillaceae bacterium]
MNKLYQQRFVIRQNLIFLIGLCLTVYFSYHTIQGNRSYLRLMSLNTVISKTQNEYDALRAEREAIEEKVVMMRPGSINRDLLEERARLVLGYRHPDEKTIVAN